MDLLTRLWFAPSDISGYEEIRRGFNRAIVEGMSRALNQHPTVIGQIRKGLPGR